MDIKKIVFKKLSELTKQKFTEESNIYELGIDSLDLVVLVTDAEDALGVEISDEELEAVKTVGDVITALKNAKK